MKVEVRDELLKSPFIYSFPLESLELKESISSFGILEPIKITEKYVLYDGGKRVKALLDLGIREVEAEIVRGDSKELLKLKFVKDKAVKSLNVIEVANALSSFLSFGGKPSELGVRNEDVRYLMFIKDLEDWEKILFLKWKLPPKAVDILNIPERKEILSLLSSLPLNYGHIRDILGWSRDISLRDGISMVDVIKNAMEGLSHLSPGRRLEIFKKNLLRMRYPVYYSSMEEVKEKIENVIPENIKIEPPPYLEGERWRLGGSFSSGEELDRIIEGLKKVKNIIYGG